VIIDAHAHVIPKDHPARDGFPVMEPIDADTARTLVFGATRFRAAEVFFETERRLEAMDAAGVDEEIVSPMPPLLKYDLDAGLALDVARHVNETVASHVREGGGRIHGLGMVALQDPDAAAAELATFAGLGLDGVEVASHVLGTTIGDARFLPFFQEVDRLGLSVFIHTMPRADEPDLAAGLRGSIGVGIEAARAAASLAFGPTAQEARLDRVLFSHAAGGLPLMLARADYFWGNEDPATRTVDPPSALARRFFFDSMVFDPRGLRFIVDYLGADRVVLGTDFPAMPRAETLARALDDLGLSTEDRDRIAYANARTFLGKGDGTGRDPR